MAVVRRAYQQPTAGSYASARIRKVLGPNLTAVGAATVPGSVAVTATDFNTIGNSVSAFRVPMGFTVTGINVTFPALDAGAALTMSIGDAASTTRFVNASTVARAGGSVTTLGGGSYYTFPVDTDILLTATAAATTPAAGTITNFYLEGFIASP
jgi:hypothetical protein